MSPSGPFFDSSSGELDTEQVLYEARPLAELIGAIGVVALIPALFQFLLSGIFAFMFAIVTQFVLAVGAGLVLMYVITRSNQLMKE